MSSSGSYSRASRGCRPTAGGRACGGGFGEVVPQTDVIIAELRDLLTLPMTSKVKVTTARTSSAKGGTRAGIKGGPFEAGVDSENASGDSREEVRESDEEKIRVVDARLADYKLAIQDDLSAGKYDYGVFIIDDFYLINPEFHPEVIDYLHRLPRDTDT
jgi:hypothetical protein